MWQTLSHALVIADFSKPSNEERLLIIDMKIMQVVLKSLVAHGRNSGTKMANQFSNQYASFQSSLGFYITGLGCPAVPNNQVYEIINTIKGASCLFVYAPTNQYLSQSQLVKN